MEQPGMHLIAIVLMIEAQVSTSNSMDISKTKLLAKECLVEALGNSLSNTPDISWGDISCLSFVVDENSDGGED